MTLFSIAVFALAKLMNVNEDQSQLSAIARFFFFFPRFLKFAVVDMFIFWITYIAGFLILRQQSYCQYLALVYIIMSWYILVYLACCFSFKKKKHVCIYIYSTSMLYLKLLNTIHECWFLMIIIHNTIIFKF